MENYKKILVDCVKQCLVLMVSNNNNNSNNNRILLAQVQLKNCTDYI